VIGAGHAGCEAALAAAKMGKRVIIFTINADSVAALNCNPNIGGTSKGHLVREIDALGGYMGKNIDKTYIQSRMLNTAKGPAVHSLRAQADKAAYSAQMKKTLEKTDNILLIEEEIIQIMVDKDKIIGVKSISNTIYNCAAVIVCGGTYFRSKCISGDVAIDIGPAGLKSSTLLSDNLRELGIKTYRFKTGTPARLDKRTIDFTKMSEQKGDEHIVPFSFENSKEDIWREQISCFLTYTNEHTHKIIKDNIHRSPMYSGIIEGASTRYCPSIEDKIVRFEDKERHQVFIEPEGEDTNEVYVGGMSTSLPRDVQVAMYQSVSGLENAQIIRTGYAIEYDAIDATSLTLSLQSKIIKGLFFAGQVNGSSGYEEAAAQGIIAGINAALLVDKKEAFVIDRTQGYIGVLIDDLVTKGTKEPYRMMTSRAEYRLLLRQDNADLRLTEFGFKLGLISNTRYDKFTQKKEAIDSEITRLKKVVVPPTAAINNLLKEKNLSEISTGYHITELIKRPELDYDALAIVDENRPNLSDEVKEQINIQIKYEGYIERQLKQVEQFKKLETKTIPENIDYSIIKGIRLEARQKLEQIKPKNLGHASRITGVSPADISMLLVYLRQS